jgi:hypothetical protein
MSGQKKMWCCAFFVLALWALGYQVWYAMRPREELADLRASLGALDTKYAQINPKGVVNLYGWAVHPAGVAEARVFVDGVYASRLNLHSTRLDVRSGYPALPGALHSGFHAMVPLNLPLRAQYEIEVQLKLHNGRTSALGPWKLTQ